MAVALSLMLHAVVLLGWLPKVMMRPSEDAKQGKPSGSLAVRLAPPPSRPPSIASAPPPAPVVQAQPAPAPKLPSPKAAPRPPSAPRVLALERPSPPTAEAARPPVKDDLASYIEARRRARESAPAPPPSQASPPSPPPESEQERQNRIVAGNLGLNRTPSFGAERNRGGGIFQIQRMGYDDAEFFFFGWNKDIRRNAQQMIEVRRGNNPTMEIAVVRRMIAIIREHANGDFQWESQRLRREITLSARVADNAGLEEFMMREFFPDFRPR